MRLSIHRIRPITTITALWCVLVIASITQAFAVTLASPTEGQVVRDQVAIIVPKSSLSAADPSTCFLSVKIDGRFVAAVSASQPVTNGKAPASPNIVYVWDTKAPIDDPLLPEDQRHYKDGKHEIVVEAHALQAGSTRDVIMGTAKANVNLQNRIERPNPAPPIRLAYHYRLGQENDYRVAINGELLESNGTSLTGGQPPIQAEFEVAQVTEDVQDDGSALLRYKVQDNGFAQVFGQINLLGQSGQVFKSVYKIIDAAGATIADNVLSTKSDTKVTDCLIKLPNKPVQVGESWPTSFAMKLEGLCELAEFKGNSRLEALEWEQGLECAKITSKLTGSPAFAFLPSGAGAVKATSTAYFAYKLGKLIKHTMVLEFKTAIERSMITNYQQNAAAAATVPGGTFPGGAFPGAMPGMPPPPGMPGSYTPPAPASSSGKTTTTAKTSVIVKLVVTQELKD
ncbi:MAG: hypothetical protein HYX78_06825 [Armatimonadetes bacterium]|nr:hypothetical protein [Armatimonadota bacterium]